ncbi:MAG TPA: hypothetical protein VMU67_03255 [Steroidobacteraceae bacterium]|nr:hypothetical protein [Steroidobacteraceae bacterium]
MGRHAGSILLAAATGVALVWLARWERSEPVRKVTAPGSRVARIADARAEGPAVARRAPELSAAAPGSGSTGDTERGAAAGSAVVEHAAIASATPPPPLPIPAGAEPPSSAAASAHPSPLDTLLDSVRISCQFDPGNGSEWPGGNMTVHGASWQGGPITYDSIDTHAGSAQMEGTQGATGSQTGETDVRVVATPTGLHFAGFTPRGDLVVTSVFAALDTAGHFIAVMSRHGAALQHESAQFYGSCSSILAQLGSTGRSP